MKHGWARLTYQGKTMSRGIMCSWLVLSAGMGVTSEPYSEARFAFQGQTPVIRQLKLRITPAPPAQDGDTAIFTATAYSVSRGGGYFRFCALMPGPYGLREIACSPLSQSSTWTGGEPHDQLPPVSRAGERHGSNTPPGAPNWHMPPADIPGIFAGRTVAQICSQIKDPARNGGLAVEGIVQHVGGDSLIKWAFFPGPGRMWPRAKPGVGPDYAWWALHRGFVFSPRVQAQR